MGIYYMHPINTYGTALEARQLKQIAEIFPCHHTIVNPNELMHQRAYEDAQRILGDGMRYFLALAEQCTMGVALPFRDGKLGAGIFKEACHMTKFGHHVWLLTHDGDLSQFDQKDVSRVLTVEETSQRVRNPDGSLRPY